MVWINRPVHNVKITLRITSPMCRFCGSFPPSHLTMTVQNVIGPFQWATFTVMFKETHQHGHIRLCVSSKHVKANQRQMPACYGSLANVNHIMLPTTSGSLSLASDWAHCNLYRVCCTAPGLWNGLQSELHNTYCSRFANRHCKHTHEGTQCMAAQT